MKDVTEGVTEDRPKTRVALIVTMYAAAFAIAAVGLAIVIDLFAKTIVPILYMGALVAFVVAVLAGVRAAQR